MVIRATARMDVLMEAETTTKAGEIVLVLEHKKPATLRRSDWTSGFYDGTHRLKDNAIILSKQDRKYVCATFLHAIETFDSQGLVSIFLKNEDRHLWATNQRIEAKIIYEDRPSRW